MERLEEAQNNDVYVCGMLAFDVDHPMRGVIIAREGLESHHPMEFEYYNTTINLLSLLAYVPIVRAHPELMRLLIRPCAWNEKACYLCAHHVPQRGQFL